MSAAAGHEHGRAVAQLRGAAGAVQQRAEAGRAQHRQAAAPVKLGQVQVGHCLCNLYSTLVIDLLSKIFELNCFYNLNIYFL